MSADLRSIRDLLTQEDLSMLQHDPSIGGARHPTWYPIFYQESRTVDVLSNRSVALVNEASGAKWLRDLHPRLVRQKDREEASAALAELRAYGGFLEAHFRVSPIPTATEATPDFSIDAGDGEVIVEVFTKQQDDQQKRILNRIFAEEIPTGTERSVARGERVTIKTANSVIQPGGAPDPAKPHDSVQANLISKVCGAKGDEVQFDKDHPSLLWIDFRSFGIWPEIVELNQATPLISGYNGLTSGALWYAFYGWCGAPICEPDFFPHSRVFPMGHDGRFRIRGIKKSKLSGAILTLSDGLVLLENPWATNRLFDRARHFCERLPGFDLGRSICDWSPGDALTLANLGRRQIESIAQWQQNLEG